VHELTVRAATFGDVPAFRELLSNILRRRGSVRRMGSDASTTATEDTRTRAPLSGPQAAALLRIGMEVQAGPEDPGIADSMPDGNGAPAPGIHPGAPVATRRTATITLAVVGISGFLAMDPGNSPEVAPNGQGAGGSVPASPHSRQEQSMNQVVRIATAGVIGAAATVGAAHAQQAVQWRVEDGGNGHWYEFVRRSEIVCWLEARDASADRSGHLVTLVSSAENEFVKSMVARHDPGVPEGGPFIGASCGAGSWGMWSWVTAEPFTFTAWSPGEPNNAGDGECYVHYWRWSSLGWNDTSACSSRSFVVEWDADCNGDGIVDYGQCHDGTLPDYNGNNIPDCCERGEACVVGNYPVQWRVEDGGNGHWYQLPIRANGIDWVSAKSIAESAGGRLAQMESATERQFLFNFSAMSIYAWNKDAGGALGPWLGALQQPGAQEPNDGWIWTDASPVNFEACHFVTSYPSGCGTNEDRMSFWCPDAASLFVGSTAYETSDYPGSGLCGRLGPIRSCLIEWSADCGHDGIVDYGQILLGQLADDNHDGIPDTCQQPTCRDADLTHNGVIDGSDLGVLLGFWGPRNPVFPQADINGDGVVNGADLGLMLSFWGQCPG